MKECKCKCHQNKNTMYCSNCWSPINHPKEWKEMHGSLELVNGRPVKK